MKRNITLTVRGLGSRWMRHPGGRESLEELIHRIQCERQVGFRPQVFTSRPLPFILRPLSFAMRAATLVIGPLFFELGLTPFPTDSGEGSNSDQQQGRGERGDRGIAAPPTPQPFRGADPARPDRTVVEEASQVVRQFAGRLVAMLGITGDESKSSSRSPSKA